MAHREDPNRGIFISDCEYCHATGVECRLVMRGDRYVWQCDAGCQERRAEQ